MGPSTNSVMKHTFLAFTSINNKIHLAKHEYTKRILIENPDNSVTYPTSSLQKNLTAYASKIVPYLFFLQLLQLVYHCMLFIFLRKVS
jgi:hypothetical protein